MRIKELHIRNIASIEKADIDFENGLNDSTTGTPASIFLISGDTGSGKSVILDGISLALYKNTPRLQGVVNPQKNTFVNAEGESVGVSSIEQYTRLGISPKDECYSEVVFDGNDGVEYRARLSLGIKLGKTDKATGRRPLKYKNVCWEVKVGDTDWIKVETKTGEPIQHAIGLSFDQFGRMAMLAQGQFAAFLTGDKKQREKILEQLTNTAHFNDYGEAIKSLFDKAKENQRIEQTAYETEALHTLSQEELDGITTEIQSFQQQSDAFEREIRDCEDRLTQVDTILNNRKSLSEAEKKKVELELVIDGDDYKRQKALIVNWDATTRQRQLFAAMKKAQKEKEQAEQLLHQQQESFVKLSADLEERYRQQQAREIEMKELQEWIEKRKEYASLFEDAKTLIAKLEEYQKLSAQFRDVTKSLQLEQAKTEGLIEKTKTAESMYRNAVEVVKEKQQVINDLTIKREKLNPEIVNMELEKVNGRKMKLNQLNSALEHLRENKSTSQRLREELTADLQTIGELKERMEKAEQNYREKKDNESQALNRLVTMQMSVDEKIVELRKHLHDGHADICPLCGQSIDHLHLENDFRGLLTPLANERETAARLLKTAEEIRDSVRREYEKKNGSIAARQKALQDSEKKISAEEQKLYAEAQHQGIDVQKPIEEQIKASVAQLETTISTLKVSQGEAESLQKQINSLLTEKKPLDEAMSKAEAAKIKTETAVENNAREIKRLQAELKSKDNDMKTLSSHISSSMSVYNASWQEAVMETRSQLEKDANEYSDHKEQLRKNKEQFQKTSDLLGMIDGLRKDILLLCPAWDVTVSPVSYRCKDIQAEWRSLYGTVNMLTTSINNNDKVIRENDEELNAYYLQSGKTETVLDELIGKDRQVEQSRKFVEDINAALKSRQDAIVDAQQKITASMEKLGISDEHEIPERNVLDQKRNALKSNRDEILSEIVKRKTRLDENAKNQNKLKDIKERLEAAKKAFAKWDKLNRIFGGNRFRTLVQTYILRPLLNNANIYLERITDRYLLTCSEENEQLSILVLDKYNKNQVRSVTVLSGGERFMISLALSLALSSLNRPDMNVNILFIDEGFGTLDEKSLDSVMSTLERLQEIAGQSNRRVGIISHREELEERIPVKIRVIKKGEGRSKIIPS